MARLKATVLLTALLAATATAQVRVRAPAAQDAATNPVECRTKLTQPHLQNACHTCVKQGGRYLIGNNACEGATPPPPPAAVIARTVDECNTIPFGPKRNRCMTCVSAGGAFFIQGAGWGYCKAAPPPPPPPVDPTIQRTVDECNREIKNPEKRLRCTTCVQGGGTYHKNLGNNLGQCSQPTPPAETNVLRTVSDCTAHAKGPRRARCVACVQGGGTFLKHTPGGGKNECVMPAAPTPPPAPAALRTAEECTSSIPQKFQRRKCLKCVAGGGSYELDSKSCVAAPAVEITTVEECKEKSAPGMRKKCRQCVKGNGRWDVAGNACKY